MPNLTSKTSPLAAAMLVFAVVAVISQSATRASPSGGEFRGLWVDTWNTPFSNASQVSQIVADARAGHFNAILVEVRRRGDAFYNSHFEPTNTSVSAGFDPLADLVAKAHDVNTGPRLEVHCWIVTYPICTAASFPPPQTNHPLNLHPDWRNKTSAGAYTDGSNYYFDPGHPGVQAYTFNVAMDIISNYDVDGLNWDYIRYPGTGWGYNDVSIARFNSRYSRTGQPSTADTQWTQFRRDQVTALARKVYLHAIAIKPNVVLSADTFTSTPAISADSSWTNSTAYKSVLQDWLAWMKEGILDLNVPMTYFVQTTAATSYATWNDFIRDHCYNRQAVVGPADDSNSISNSIVQIRMTRKPTAQGNTGFGVACYDYAVNNNEGQPYSVFASALTQPGGYDPIQPPVFQNVDYPPDRPWKTAPAKGHLKGFVYADATNALDGATVALNGPTNVTLTTDATGFYGAVDLPPGQYAVTGSYLACATNSQIVSITAGAVATLDLSLAATGLGIILQPQNLTAVLNSNATLSVSALGAKPLYYQWRLNSLAFPGATQSALSFSPVQAASAGTYSVVVSNSTGSITSLPAVVNVQFSLTTCANGNGSISISPSQSSYAANTSVTLTATPGAAATFTNWTGDILSSSNPLTIVLTNSLSITGNFVSAPYDLILDNDSAFFTGTWYPASSSTDRYGTDYEYTMTTSNQTSATATYRPVIPASGNYNVFVWYSQGSNRATNVPCRVSFYNGTNTILLNQTANGGKWNQITTNTYFMAGTNGFVQLQNGAGYGGKVLIADAVRFSWSSSQPQQSAPVATLARPVGTSVCLASTNDVLQLVTSASDPQPYPPGALAVGWTQVAGSGTVTFGGAPPLTTASFSDDGVYSLCFTASNGLSTNIFLTVFVNPAPDPDINLAPEVSAGGPQTLRWPGYSRITGAASDDGKPNPPNALAFHWRQLSGPGTTLFVNSNALSTIVGFSAPGDYRLSLSADDGQAQTCSGATVSAAATDPALEAPPYYRWIVQGGGTGDDNSLAVALDASGNIYWAGYFSSSNITFGNVTLTNTSTTNMDVFLAKYDPAGNLLWAKKAGGPAAEKIQSINIDSGGNVIVVGIFQQTMDLFGTLLTSAGGLDIFYAKLSPDGTVLWARSAGSAYDDYTLDATLDHSDGFVMTGYFRDRVTFGNTTIVCGPGSPTRSDLYVARFDSQGNTLWARQAGGAGDDVGYGVAVDSHDNVFVSGYFNNTATFQNTNITSRGGQDAFIAKYDNAGNFLWVRQAGSTGSEIARAVRADLAGNVFVTGHFNNTVDFGTTNLTSFGGYDCFLTKYDPDGTLLWARQGGGANMDLGNHVQVDSAGNAYVAGFAQGDAQFDSLAITNMGMTNLFIAKYAPGGQLLWLKASPGIGANSAHNIALGGDGALHVVGQFTGLTFFGRTNLASSGGTDVFLARLEEPALTGSPQAGNLSLAWITNAAGFNLETSFDLNQGWWPWTNSSAQSAGYNRIMIPLDRAQQYFRLKQR